MVGVENEKSEPKRNETKTFVEKWRISPTSLTLALRIFHTLDEETTGLNVFLINLGYAFKKLIALNRKKLFLFQSAIKIQLRLVVH